MVNASVTRLTVLVNIFFTAIHHAKTIGKSTAISYNTESSVGGLAQLARAVGSQSTGRGFESHILHHAKKADPSPR
jgi:O-succinylbenzoate synthase